MFTIQTSPPRGFLFFKKHSMKKISQVQNSKEQMLEKLDALKQQIDDLSNQIEIERLEATSEDDAVIRQELVDKKEFLSTQMQELQESISMSFNHKEIGRSYSLAINGQTRMLHIVPPSEANPGAGHISMESPLAKALSSSKQGEVVTVETPLGMQQYKVIAVQ